MPRGVYDRSKMKNKKASASEAPAKTPGKRGRKPKAVTAVATASTKIVKTSDSDARQQIREVLATLATLTQVGTVWPLESVKAEVQEHLTILSRLRAQVFQTEPSDEESTASNGTTQASAPVFATSQVPMPPAPTV